MSTFKLFSGSANPEFAKKVGDYLGMCVSDATLNRNLVMVKYLFK